VLVTKLNAEEARQNFSDLLGRVQDGETVLITQLGLPVAKLVPASAEDDPGHPANIKGWLEDDDPFFAAVDEIVEARFQNRPRPVDLSLQDEDEEAS
jgi:prevent-host-death family protein